MAGSEDSSMAGKGSRPAKVAVVGAGAMGSVYGAAFQNAGNDVWLVDVNRSLVEKINADGLVVERRDGFAKTYRIRATSDPAEIGAPMDLVVFLVKGFSTHAAANLVSAIVGPDTVLLTLQNGLGNEEILRETFPDNPVLIGNSVHSVSVVELGRVSHTGVRGTYVGPADDEWAVHAERAGAALEGSGFEYEILSGKDIRHQIWAKFVMNCGSLPTLALTGLPTAQASELEVAMGLVDELVRETCRIAEAAGVELDAEERVQFSRELFRTAGGKASMLQDVERRNRTEIDSINGAAVRYADKYGVPAPLNRAMFALVKGREASWETTS